MTVVEPVLRDAIAQRVEQALERYQPRNYRVKVNPDAILQDDEWFHVVVTSPDDRRDRDFYDALAQAETDLNEQDTEHQYLLVPAIGE